MKRLKGQYFFPAYSFAVLIFIGASVPSGEFGKIKGYNKLVDFLLSDYFLHFFAFGIFAGLLCFGFYKSKKPSLPYVRIGLYSFGFGLLIEFYQIILPSRFFGLEDLVSDGVGIILFLILFRIYFFLSPHKRGPLLG